MKSQNIINFAAIFLAALLVGNVANAQHEAQQRTPDQIRAAVQGICPVSGLELGAHGPPIKVKIGGEVLFLCCDSCKKGKVKKEHWAKIHQNFAKAQAKCFVMDNALPKSPKWVVINGELIYVCCPPCIEKIKASPEQYVQKLRTQQLAYLNSQNGADSDANAVTNHGAHAAPHEESQHDMTAEQGRIAVQEICPVSGLKLGAHGPPIKSTVGGESIFLCCDSCKNGKVKKEHWAKIHQNFAKAQAKCFVMDNPLPKSPKWVVVKGQLIYVCCPPCIEKIKASPDEYLRQLAATHAAYIQSKTSTASAELQNTGQ